jgi:hypothetical protein
MTSHEPHKIRAARSRSVRARRRVYTNPTTSRISAAGSSHEIWPPISESNSRVSPVAPHRSPVPPNPPPTLPVSLPVSRPRPL